MSQKKKKDDAFAYLKATFDCLYREGEQTPKMMSIGLHPRISGRPARIEAISRFINYIQEKAIWLCSRQDIAQFWIDTFSEQ